MPCSKSSGTSSLEGAFPTMKDIESRKLFWAWRDVGSGLYPCVWKDVTRDREMRLANTSFFIRFLRFLG